MGVPSSGIPPERLRCVCQQRARCLAVGRCGCPAQPLASRIGTRPPGPLVGPSWRPGQGRGQSPGLRAQQRLFPFTCPVSLTVLGEGGARCPVPAPDSLSRICFSVPGQDSGKVVIWNMSPVLQEDAEKDERVPKMLCQMDNHLGISGPFAGFACWRSSQGQHVRLWSESSGRAALAPVACCLTRRSWLHTGVSYSAEDPARPQNLLWTVRRYLW